jgi:hypothetical protein
VQILNFHHAYLWVAIEVDFLKKTLLELKKAHN